MKWSEIPRFNQQPLITIAAEVAGTMEGVGFAELASAAADRSAKAQNRLFQTLFLLSAANVGVNVLMAELGVFRLGGQFY